MDSDQKISHFINVWRKRKISLSRWLSRKNIDFHKRYGPKQLN